MCNRMAQTQLDRIRAFAQKAFDLMLQKLLQASFNAAPTELLPVVLKREGRYVEEMMSWGVNRARGRW